MIIPFYFKEQFLTAKNDRQFKLNLKHLLVKSFAAYDSDHVSLCHDLKKKVPIKICCKTKLLLYG